MLVVKFTKLLIFLTLFYEVYMEDASLEDDTIDSSERLGPAVAQVGRHPYAAVVLKNNTYECSAVILNAHWLLTSMKCFNESFNTHTYVYQRELSNYTIRVGSSYNHKGGSIYKIKRLINNLEMQVTAIKAHAGIEFGPGVESANLPLSEEYEPSLGNLATMMAWTPDGHLRTINAPVINPSICDDADNHMNPGQYICIGGVQDPDRHFCRKDTGGAIIQNKTLIGITTFAHSCALYIHEHAFPMISALMPWLDSNIWDESERPTLPPTTAPQVTTIPTTTEQIKTTRDDFYQDYTVAVEPPNNIVLLRDNNVAPRISMYEAYLEHLQSRLKTTRKDNYQEHTILVEPQIVLKESTTENLEPNISLYEAYLKNLQRMKTSTTKDPRREAQVKMQKVLKMLSPPAYARNYDLYDYNE